ncbi:MAG: ribosome-associated translation inhibitor RaiA [Lactobacillales bacterium]|nr:ribosome-associated translation inhibitor RaiA [Lactobacillales bacterium]
MRYNIRGSKMEVTDSIRNYIEEKLGKLDKYFENPDEITASVLVRESGINDKVEVTIPIKTTILRAEVSTKDLYEAIDLVVEKLERQIRKNKTRMNKINKESIVAFIDFEITEEEKKEEAVVKRKTVEMKPMSEEEAILQMNLIGHDFFIFKNSATDEVSVLYRRNDEQYGIIDVK